MAYKLFDRISAHVHKRRLGILYKVKTDIIIMTFREELPSIISAKPKQNAKALVLFFFIFCPAPKKSPQGST